MSFGGRSPCARLPQSWLPVLLGTSQVTGYCKSLGRSHLSHIAMGSMQFAGDLSAVGLLGKHSMVFCRLVPSSSHHWSPLAVKVDSAIWLMSLEKTGSLPCIQW